MPFSARRGFWAVASVFAAITLLLARLVAVNGKFDAEGDAEDSNDVLIVPNAHIPAGESEPGSEHGEEVWEGPGDYRRACNGFWYFQGQGPEEQYKLCGVNGAWWRLDCPPACIDLCQDSSRRVLDLETNLPADRRDVADVNTVAVPTYTEWNPYHYRFRRGLVTGDFDQVYLSGDWFCLSTCKSKVKMSGCHEYHDFNGRRFCRFLKCSGTIDGCHRTNDFNKLTCAACQRIFPSCDIFAFSSPASHARAMGKQTNELDSSD